MNIFLIKILLITLFVFSQKIEIMEIDTGVSLDHEEISSHVDNTENEYDYQDDFGHGTHLAGIILKNTCPAIKLVSCRFMEDSSHIYSDKYIECLQKALKENIKIINISSTGYFFWQTEYNLMMRLSQNGAIIVVAAGNDGRDFSEKCIDNYPACYNIKNLIVVGAKDYIDSNSGIPGMFWENGMRIKSTLPFNRYGYMSGTSQATAVWTNKFLRNICEKIK